MKDKPVTISLDKKTEKMFRDIQDSLSSVAFALGMKDLTDIEDIDRKMRMIEYLTKHAHLTKKQMATVNLYGNLLAERIVARMESELFNYRKVCPEEYDEFIDRHMKYETKGGEVTRYMTGPFEVVVIDDEVLKGK